uniref:Uncharacterized protein n=1 Tax=Zea mays TaxID=4577 RepID=C4J110_MAIZE|nr:unknown [Zea mays]
MHCSTGQSSHNRNHTSDRKHIAI